jgi:digeranylgeranylglycerophospholipid reductase
MTGMQPDFDVVVIGAGPAGSTTTKCLLDLRPDARVLLVDKAHQFPRDKPCGGFVDARLLEAFPYLHQREGHFVESESTLAVLHSPDLRYEVSGHTRMLAVLRSTFDAYLVGLAQQAGAQVATNRQVSEIAIGSDAASIGFTDGGRLTAHAIVGADGATSLVAHRSGLCNGWRSHEICKTVMKEFPVEPAFILEQCGPERPVHLYLQFNGLPGYAWFFPKAYHINVGVGCFASVPVRLISYFQLLVRLLQRWNMLPSTATTEDVKGDICPTKGPLNTTQTHRVLLVGDAAGFVSPATGAGIVPGMISGRLAAETLAEALSHRRFGAAFLNRYQLRWQQQIGRFEAELWIQRIFLTRFCNLFIRIGQQDALIRNVVAEAQTGGPLGPKGVSISHLLGRVCWDLLRGAFGQL